MRVALALVVALLGSSLGVPAKVQAQEIKDNTITGSCKAFEDYIENNGVNVADIDDATGVRTPPPPTLYLPPNRGKCAAFTFHYVKSIVSWDPLTSAKGPNGKTCWSSVAHVNVEIIGPGIDELDWHPDPPACDPDACCAALKAWHEKVMAHEDGHWKATLNAIKSINEQVTNVSVTYCVLGRYKKKVIAKELEDLVWSEVDARSEDLLEKSRHDVDYPLGHLDTCPSPPCGACAPCSANQPGQTPTVCSCPAGQVWIKGHCYTQPPGGCAFSEDPLICGKTADGYQRGCCPVKSLNTSVCADANNMCPPE